MTAQPSNLAFTLRNKHVVPPLPLGKVQGGAGQEPEAKTVDDENPSTCCFIEYVDANGEPSSRTITFRSIAGDFGQIDRIYAHCHLRNASREFLISGITEMVCNYTGEVLDPFEHCLSLQRGGALKVEDRPLVRIMRIVTFLARCDSHYHDLEEKALDGILGRYFRNFGGDDAAYECARREAVKLAPTGRQALSAVSYLRRLPHSEELARFAIRAAAEIVDADGVHHPDEVYWGIELGNMLKQIAKRDGKQL